MATVNPASLLPTSRDTFPRELMDELRAARKPYALAYDTLYRRERMLRYAYWLHHGAKPPFNFIGTWIPDQMRKELAMWKSMLVLDCDDLDVIETVSEDLERRFGISLPDAKGLVTNPELARLHYPIWDAAADCLIDQKLGAFLIQGVSSYSEPHQGLSYAYRHTVNDAPLTLYLYDFGLAPVQPGVSDPRFAAHFGACMADVEANAVSRGQRGGGLNRLIDPQVEVICSRVDVEIPFASTAWESVSADGQRRYEGLSVTGFRDMFLKIRLTCPMDFLDTDTGRAAINDLNLDVADLVIAFGHPKPEDDSTSVAGSPIYS